MAPPLPEASQPSSRTHSGGPTPWSPVSPPSTSRSCSSRVCAASRRSASSLRLSRSERSRPSSALTPPRMPNPVPRPLPPKPDFPRLEEEVLQRWRERDVFHESVRRRQGAEPYVFYEGPPTANGRPGSAPRAGARVQGHLPALPDHARPLRRAQGRLGLPRPAGRDRGRAEARLHLQGRHRALRHRRVQRQVPRVGVRVPRGLERADRADRLLGRPRRSVPHARAVVHRVGVVGAEDDVGARTAVRGLQGRPVLRPLRHRAVLARGLGGLPGRRGPERLRARSR